MTQSGLSFPSIPHQLSCLTGKSTLRLCAEPPTYQKTDTAGVFPGGIRSVRQKTF